MESITTSAPTLAIAAAAAAPSNSVPTASVAERLAQLLSLSVNAQTIYGSPVEREGVTVIPVAQAAYGFGGGSGTSTNAQGGTGGGGGVRLKPVGFIELKEGRSRFRPIRRSMVPLVAVGGLLALLLLRAVPRRLVASGQGA